jgi:hypothetical protein
MAKTSLNVQLFSGESKGFQLSDKNEVKISDIATFLFTHYGDAELQYEMSFVSIKDTTNNSIHEAFKLTRSGESKGSVPSLDRILTVFNEWFTGDNKDINKTLVITKEEKPQLKRHVLIIMPSLAFVSKRYYEPRPRTGFEAVSIRIFEPEKHSANVTEYYNALDTEAAVLKYRPRLQVPIEPEALISHSRSRITFLAFDDTENRLVGFCSCIISRYRHEFRDEIKAFFKTALKDEEKIEDRLVKKYPLYDTRDKEKRPKTKYYPGAPLYFEIDEKKQHKIRCIYDIDSLSVLPSFAGKNIGLTLLYHAFLFITGEKQRIYYPVTHFVSYSASARTLRFLRDTFQFVYYGENEFHNENFVWTLSNDQKETVVKQIESLLEVYQIIFKYLEDKKEKGVITEAGELFFSKNGERAKLKDMLVSLYQLYLLIIQSVIENQKQSAVALDDVNYFSATIFARFEALFDIFKLKNPVKGTDARYETFYLYDYSEDMNFFVKDPALDPEYERFTYYQCYDVIYKAIGVTASPILQENAFLESSKKILKKIDKITNSVAKELNTILLDDLKKDFNYQVPYREIASIIASLFDIDFRPDMELSNQKFDLLDALWKKRFFIGQYNSLYDAIFQSAFDDIKGDDETTRFDTFIAFDAFLEKFPGEITDVYNQKISRNEPIDINPPVASQSDSQSVREKENALLVDIIEQINEEEQEAASAAADEEMAPIEDTYLYDDYHTIIFFLDSLGNRDSILNAIQV